MKNNVFVSIVAADALDTRSSTLIMNSKLYNFFDEIKQIKF